MTETVDPVERHIIPLAKLFQPVIGRLRIHVLAVPCGEQSVGGIPLAAQPLLLALLKMPECFEHK